MTCKFADIRTPGIGPSAEAFSLGSRARVDTRVLFIPEAHFRQTASITAVWLATSKTLSVGNPLWWHVLASSVTNCNGPDAVHHPKCVRRRNSPSTNKLRRLVRSSVPSAVICSKQPYNSEMGKRVVCSCVTCPKCGIWVVVSQRTEGGENKKKFRESCPAPECGKEFEFEAGETRVFEVSLPLFERRHFYRSELI
jgi:hypothetical protein